MKLEQHFYTSGKPEFMTVAITDGISREERIQLESNSIYFLPVSLHYEENVTTPVKYVWYPLGEQHFVVGRAIYKGKDSLGRTGNYLFHNYVVRQDDFMAACQSNPVSLIMRLRQYGMFLDEAPDGDIQPIDLANEQLAVPQSLPQNVSREVLQRVLHACLEHYALHQPGLLLGTEDECLQFLERIYTVLPYEVRLALRVDTYAYGVSLGFPIIGSLDEEVFYQGLTSSFTLRLSTLETTVYDEFSAPSPYLTMLLEMSSEGDMAALHEVFALEYALTKQQFQSFKQQFQQVSLDIRQILWDFHGSRLLNYITAEEDMELLRMIRPLLKIEHIDTLYLAPELIEHLIEDHEPNALSIVAQWLCTPGSKELFYPSLFASMPLWNVWLDTVQAHPETAVLLLEPLKAFKQNYSIELEQSFLEHLLTFLPYVLESRKLAREFEDLLAELPSLPSDISNRKLVSILRTFIRYELNSDAALLSELLQSDLTVLSTGQRAVVLESLLDNMLVLRALQMWNPEKVAQQLRTLLAKAERDQSFAQDVLTAMTRLQLSRETHKVVEQVLTDLRPSFVQGNEGPQIQQLINQVLQPPPSIFSKLTHRLFGFK